VQKTGREKPLVKRKIELKVSMVNIMASLNDRICVAAQLHITALTLSCPELAATEGACAQAAITHHNTAIN